MGQDKFTGGEPGGSHVPLADRMRPLALEEMEGQEHLLGKGKIITRILESGHIPSMIFWGPPGSGKTSLAHLVAGESGKIFVPFSAVTAGVKRVRQIVAEAEKDLEGLHKQGTLLFVDEIHRFNKAQQDAFLPHVEKGTIVLVGATTENPSFEVIAPLLSRMKVLVLKPLSDTAIVTILKKALSDSDRGVGKAGAVISDKDLQLVASMSQGDVRFALNTLEIAVSSFLPDGAGGEEGGAPKHPVIGREALLEAMQKSPLIYDKAGEEHYNIISAMHKSLRDSDADAAVYWITRMLEAGEDPFFIMRRLVRFASEDIGLADPGALQVAMAAKEAVGFIGMPEAALAVLEAAIYLASAPKSNSLYEAHSRVRRLIRDTGALPVPLHIRNAPTRLMKSIGYGDGYKYAHNYEDGVTGQEHLPDKIRGSRFYRPGRFGFEKEIAKRIDWWEARKRKLRGREKGGGSR